MEALRLMELARQGNKEVIVNHPWLKRLVQTKECNENLERVRSMDELNRNVTFDSVHQQLQLLDLMTLNESDKSYVDWTLRYSEVAKCGMPHERRTWERKGINLFAHNLGSAAIFSEDFYAGKLGREITHRDALIIRTLIATHGLIGQYLRGEVSLSANRPLTDLIGFGALTPERLTSILVALNHCIIAAVSQDLWLQIQDEVKRVVERVVNADYGELPLKERVRRLRSASIRQGEDFDQEYDRLFTAKVTAAIDGLIGESDLWYVEAALHDFNMEEFVKVLLLINHEVNRLNWRVRHVSFEPFMRNLYYQYNGEKKVNIYQKRIIGKYLASMSVDDILKGKIINNPHAKHNAYVKGGTGDVVCFNFKYSPAGQKLIEFCVEAEQAGEVMYEKAILMLLDFFGLRIDGFDRLHNEDSYLRTMNSVADYKKVILDFVKGQRIMDIGPGGGVLLDMLEKSLPGKQIIGLDFSKRVVETLQKKRKTEGHLWDVRYGNALELSSYVDQVDTIIYCSIVHELFSFAEFGGKRYNYDTLRQTFREAWKTLSVGGRIIIRDPIMTEPKEQARILRFRSAEGMDLLTQFVHDFKGRKIQYQVVGHNEVLMPINDAKEFLLTVTWGKDSYAQEVEEMLCYFTPTEYRSLFADLFGAKAKCIYEKSQLQEGYVPHLSQIAEILDEQRQPTVYPDTTYMLVIEKVAD